ncbi:multidrug efflux SMR transporter [Aquibacillus sp. 3ASR75-11]|uniref:Multidrug efflux SMR transporter n=1 Tax=Terrihalobacillus insolitus TaxID=2950438 RepID=A0A9X4AKD8_9BACI|nr:multidrug efflux SMR transporter [Terrihalobacillus insolitus]MDC3412326.1 multidrug efflux SMR transporter [Terrihalobacillus insolitus]MDC3422981.1 multidrug efflux SMR transporter [Terrihalobacillus insolitus]
MAWVLLVIAGISETLGVIGINQINRSKNVLSYAILLGGFTSSFVFLSLAMESITMSTAYAIWTGIGTVGSVIIGIIFYNEAHDWKRILCIGLVLTAAVGLKLID